MLRLAALTIASWLLASATPPVGPGTPHFDGMPPPRFQGEAVVTIVFLTQANLEQACAGKPLPPGYSLRACTRRAKSGQKVIFMPLPGPAGYAGEYYAQLLTHEIGHSSFGWSGDHPL